MVGLAWSADGLARPRREEGIAEEHANEALEKLNPVEDNRLQALGIPAIDFTADVKARELRFDEVPKAEVRFWGDARRISVSGTERKNLPEEVQRGVEYRNVNVRLLVATELIDTEPGP